jgi:hypothetical protein
MSPVLFGTYQRLAGDVPGWDDRFANLANHEVEVRRPIMMESPEEYFDHSTRLSDADVSVLDSVWDQFGAKDHFALADHIHTNCREWTDQNGSPSTVSHGRLFEALGFDGDAIAELMARLEEIDQINAVSAAHANA